MTQTCGSTFDCNAVFARYSWPPVSQQKHHEAELLVKCVACPLKDGWSGQHNTSSEPPTSSMTIYWLECFTLDFGEETGQKLESRHASMTCWSMRLTPSPIFHLFPNSPVRALLQAPHAHPRDVHIRKNHLDPYGASWLNCIAYTSDQSLLLHFHFQC